MTDKIDPVLIQVLIGMITILGTINAFFIRSLISKIDKADKSITKYEEQIIQLKDSIAMFSVFIKDLTEVKSDVAVLKYALEQKDGGTHGTVIRPS